MNKNFKEYLPHIKAFAFDVDGVLSANCIPLYPNGEPMRMANIKDGYVLQLAIKLGYPIAIITGGKTAAVRTRFEGLGIQDIYLGSSIKTIDFEHFIAKHGLHPTDVLYMGDDIPDLPVMKLVGMPTCPSDAAAEIKAISCYVSNYRGGEGCVRDVIEQVLKAQNKWLTDEHAFGW